MTGDLGHPEQVRFFNVSLMNANVMSMPRFPQPQRLIGELIHSIEAANPVFAWVQFLFKRRNLSPTLVALKNSIQSAAGMIKTPQTSWISGAEHDRKELHRDWYARSGERMKRIDSIVNTPNVLLAIQGMWAGDPGSLSALPFKDCHDEHDRLGVFVYRNPRMLLELVERRMVEDISRYLLSYTGSRQEPPSLLITQEEIPYFVHLPVARTPDFLKSLGSRALYTSEIRSGRVEGEETNEDTAVGRVLRLAKVPEISEALDDEEAERLAFLPAQCTRGFEVLFNEGETQILFSARTTRDMQEYLGVMKSVYGVMDIVEAPLQPKFLKQLPQMIGLSNRSSRSAAR